MFRDNLKAQIEYKGLIIKELAALTGISKRTLDTYVDRRGVIPSADVAVRIAKALNTTVEYLVTGNPSAEKISDTSDNQEDVLIFRKHHKLLKKIDNLSERDRKLVENLITDMEQSRSSYNPDKSTL